MISNTTSKMSHTSTHAQYKILVLMDEGLKEFFTWIKMKKPNKVAILVLMDEGLRDKTGNIYMKENRGSQSLF